MRKQLKVKCELNLENTDEAILTIIHQTHFDYDFGRPNSTKPWEFRAGTVCLASNLVGVKISLERYPGMLYLSTLTANDIRYARDRSVKIPAKYWPAIRNAVEVYNSHFSE